MASQAPCAFKDCIPKAPSIDYRAMILLKNYFVNTTEGVDVVTVLHEVNRTIAEAAASEGQVNIMVPESGAALALIHPLPEIVDNLKLALAVYPGEGVLAKTRRKEEIDVGARVASAMLGRSLTIPISGGKLVVGAREEPVLIDLEKGGRRREFYVQVVGEAAGQQQQKQPQRQRR